MGRKGKSWKRIHAIHVVVNDEHIIVELDELEKVKDTNSLSKIKPIAIKPLPTTQNETTQNNDSNAFAEKVDIISDNVDDLNDEESFFDSQLFMNPLFDGDLFGNLLFDTQQDFIFNDLNL